MKFTRIATLVALLCALTAQNVYAAKPGLDHYFKKPDFSGFQLSPDGTHIAGLAPVGERQNIVVINLETKKSRAVTSVKAQDVRGFQWATDDRLIFFMDDDGNESFGIFAVNRDGSRPKTLIEPAETQIRGGSRVVKTAGIINRLKQNTKPGRAPWIVLLL